MMKLWQACFLGAIVLGPPALGAAPADPAPPTTSPAADKIDLLVIQLGDPSPAVRDQAFRQLRQIGQPALPALKQAAAGNDPEARSRALALVRRIELRPIPGPMPGGVGHRFGAQGLRASVTDGQRTLDLTDEGGRKIRIREDANGLEMTITGWDEGKQITEIYTAKDAAELRDQSPEAHALYRRWARVFQGIGQGALAGGPGGANRPAVGIPIPTERDLYREKLLDHMTKAQTPPEQRRQVLQLLDELEDAEQIPVGLEGIDRDKRLQEIFAKSDAARQKIAQLQLPDPGDALPPPSKTRLGIEIRSTTLLEAPDDRLAVDKIATNSRAEKIGLKSGDVLYKLNDKEVRTIQDLRRLLAETDKPLILEIGRKGQRLELREK